MSPSVHVHVHEHVHVIFLFALVSTVSPLAYCLVLLLQCVKLEKREKSNGGNRGKGRIKVRKGCDKGARDRFAAAMSTSSSGGEDVPSPAAAVLARRASRKVKEKTCNVRMARRAGPRKGKEEQKKEKSKERRVACWRDADGRRWIDSAFL